MTSGEISRLKGNKKLLDALRQDGTRQDGTEETGRENSVAAPSNDALELLKNRLTVKDKQIEALNTQVKQIVELDRETNILLKELHDKLLLLEQSKREVIEPAERSLTDEKERGRTGRGRENSKRLLALAIALLLTLGAFFYLNINYLFVFTYK